MQDNAITMPAEGFVTLVPVEKEDKTQLRGDLADWRSRNQSPCTQRLR